MGFCTASPKAPAAKGKAKVHHVEVSDPEEYDIYTLKLLGGARWVVTLLIDGTQMEMEIDTGLAVSIYIQESLTVTIGRQAIESYVSGLDDCHW